MKKYLILIAGSPATGKTYLINEMKKSLPEMFVITPDEGKEIFADSVGFDNLAEKAQLEKHVWDFYYNVLTLYMNAGKRIILSEYPFSGKQINKLQALSEKYHYEVITVRLIADFDILWQRRKLRDVENDRHLSHIMSHYHFGDQLDNRHEADSLITEESFRKIIEDRGYHQFQLGELTEFDVSDYQKVDYQSFIKKLKQRIMTNQ
ncbi:putative kinase [Enterococcus sp. PF1-24]|uniref:AAA family ATPase n=1 Tax=unclassified Enterococcus TaxID=2608891 RepID=UPI002476EF11|nr:MULTISPECIES: AAA family ATPase [unclassified Enterococcus]MDH6363742.1 putative kinase [Enterococcus sp. PFB1-1]MDH6400698.1 putative kinase [Enterococcus sp. PF1-24]